MSIQQLVHNKTARFTLAFSVHRVKHVSAECHSNSGPKKYELIREWKRNVEAMTACGTEPASEASHVVEAPRHVSEKRLCRAREEMPAVSLSLVSTRVRLVS